MTTLSEQAYAILGAEADPNIILISGTLFWIAMIICFTIVCTADR